MNESSVLHCPGDSLLCCWIILNALSREADDEYHHFCERNHLQFEQPESRTGQIPPDHWVQFFARTMMNETFSSRVAARSLSLGGCDDTLKNFLVVRAGRHWPGHRHMEFRASAYFDRDQVHECVPTGYNTADQHVYSRSWQCWKLVLSFLFGTTTGRWRTAYFALRSSLEHQCMHWSWIVIFWASQLHEQETCS